MMHFNSNGLKNNVDELKQAINYDLVIVLINETHLKPTKSVYFHHYKIYRNGRQTDATRIGH